MTRVDGKLTRFYLLSLTVPGFRLIYFLTPRGTLGFKSFDSASITLNGIEMVRMIRKGQIKIEDKSV